MALSCSFAEIEQIQQTGLRAMDTYDKDLLKECRARLQSIRAIAGDYISKLEQERAETSDPAVLKQIDEQIAHNKACISRCWKFTHAYIKAMKPRYLVMKWCHVPCCSG